MIFDDVDLECLLRKVIPVPDAETAFRTAWDKAAWRRRACFFFFFSVSFPSALHTFHTVSGCFKFGFGGFCGFYVFIS